MPDNIQSAMFEILKRVQTDLASVKTDVSEIKSSVARLDGRVERLEGRVERLEDIAKKQRRDSAAMLVMMRGTVGIFNERLNELDVNMVLLKERGQ